MSKHRVLSLKPHLRLEWRGQDGQDETQKPDHSASLGDSVTSSTTDRVFGTHGGAKMTLARIEPDKPGYDLRTFECTKCNNVDQYIVEYGTSSPWVLVVRGIRPHQLADSFLD